ESSPVSKQTGQLEENFRQADNRKFTDVGDRATTRRSHRIAGHAECLQPGNLFTQSANERTAKSVGRGLGGDKTDLQRFHQRIILRSLALKNSTNGARAGSFAARSSSASRASARRSPERYKSR